MRIHPIIAHNPLQNIFYILEYGEKQALVIDPPEVKLAQDFLDEHNLELQRILITHEHYDHYDGVEGLNCSEVYASDIAAQNMPITVSHTFGDGDIVFEADNISIKAIATPGHADGHMIFELSEGRKIATIFSWDALFQWWVGHTRRWGTEILYESLQKFKKYDNEVIIYSWHDYLETNIKFLKIHNPDNLWEIETAWKNYLDPLYFTNLLQERKYNPFLTASRDEFIRLRELRNNF